MLLMPLEVFLGWLKKLPPRHRKNIVYCIVEFMPVCDLDSRSGKYLSRFEFWLREQSTSPAKELGLALAMKAIIDFTIMSAIIDYDQWETQVRNVDSLIRSLSADKRNKLTIEKLKAHQAKLQFNSAQSIKMKKSWIKLCDVYFSDKALKESLLHPVVD